MDALELLRSDHDTVRELFRQFEDAEQSGDTARQQELCQTIAEELQLHTAIEEQVFYPAARQAGPEIEALVREGIEEHHLVDQLMEELEALDPSHEAFVPKVQVLIENVEHHAEEEEQELFPELREAFGDDRLAELGEELQKAKQRGGRPEPTREELYDKAQEQDVSGRSKMDKDELAEAVDED
ncbi:MAG: hemerythrin domain-containing protein [Actinomycetota bacterium]|nr:hemerythrin domain-containing protein [Actinomycetota bacterium]